MSSLDIYYDKNCDLSIIKKKKVAILGYALILLLACALKAQQIKKSKPMA